MEAKPIILKMDKKSEFAVLTLRGQVDIKVADDLKTHLIEGLGKTNNLKIDMQNLEELDAAILQVLLSATNLVKELKGSVTIQNGPLPSAIPGLNNLGISKDQFRSLIEVK